MPVPGCLPPNSQVKDILHIAQMKERVSKNLPYKQYVFVNEEKIYDCES